MESDKLYYGKELFARIAEGEEIAYRQLFGDYFDQLKWYAFKLLKSSFWAEETVQEVFINLWQARLTLASIDNPTGYLYRMTANRCFDRIRRHNLEVEMQYVASIVLHGSGPTYQKGSYDLQKIEQYLKEVVETLPEQRRLIYFLQQEEGLTYQQIADRLKISKHTVRNQMAKTLQTIRAYLLKKGPFTLVLFSHLYFS